MHNLQKAHTSQGGLQKLSYRAKNSVASKARDQRPLRTSGAGVPTEARHCTIVRACKCGSGVRQELSPPRLIGLELPLRFGGNHTHQACRSVIQGCSDRLDRRGILRIDTLASHAPPLCQWDTLRSQPNSLHNFGSLNFRHEQHERGGLSRTWHWPRCLQPPASAHILQIKPL